MGQALAGLAQPTFLNLPPAVASIWFPIDERFFATTIGSVCSPIGNALGGLISSAIVIQSLKSGSSTEYTIHGMPELMLVEFIICVVPFA
eukprot:gene44068-54760_t